MDRSSGNLPCQVSRINRGAATPPRGQVIVMFALMMTGLLGMVGLAMDLGYSFSQRRNTQNAADAGALAGALATLKQTDAKPYVDNAVAGNQFASSGAAPTVESCDYVPYTMKDDSTDSLWLSLGDCASSPPLLATGVHVHTRETHATFFMRVLGINTVTTTGVATAHVQILKPLPGDAPFIVCGSRTRPWTGPSTPANAVLKLDALSPTGWSFNKNADGVKYEIHGPNLTSAQRCGAGAEFKGYAKGSINAGLSVPGYLNYDTGDDAGLINNDVNGVNGCKAGVPLPASGCVMFVPVAVNVPIAEPGGSSDQRVYVVTFGAFLITCEAPTPSGNCNRHSGVFIYDYSVLGPGDPTTPWDPTKGDPVTLRLTQ
jgi:hypothetical protein